MCVCVCLVMLTFCVQEWKRKCVCCLSHPQQCCGTDRPWTLRCGCAGWPQPGSYWHPQFWFLDTAVSAHHEAQCWSRPPAGSIQQHLFQPFSRTVGTIESRLSGSSITSSQAKILNYRVSSELDFQQSHTCGTLNMSIWLVELGKVVHNLGRLEMYGNRKWFNYF